MKSKEIQGYITNKTIIEIANFVEAELMIHASVESNTHIIFYDTWEIEVKFYDENCKLASFEGDPFIINNILRVFDKYHSLLDENYKRNQQHYDQLVDKIKTICDYFNNFDLYTEHRGKSEFDIYHHDYMVGSLYIDSSNTITLHILGDTSPFDKIIEGLDLMVYEDQTTGNVNLSGVLTVNSIKNFIQITII